MLTNFLGDKGSLRSPAQHSGANESMRIEKINPKITAEVAIGEELVGFFQEVSELIKQNDELTTIPSDDLLQTEFVYGGLTEEESDIYGFTYFPEQITRTHPRPTWSILLSASEIESISSGQKKTLALWKCQNPDCQSFFASKDETCFDCDYIDDEETVEKKRILRTLPQSEGREDWVKAYLAHFPDANPFEVIGDYNSQPQLGEKWGYFSLNDMRQLIDELKD